LNRRHIDFQSTALPPELSWQRILIMKKDMDSSVQPAAFHVNGKMKKAARMWREQPLRIFLILKVDYMTGSVGWSGLSAVMTLVPSCAGTRRQKAVVCASSPNLFSL
jgi:hypothetical protein